MNENRAAIDAAKVESVRAAIVTKLAMMGAQLAVSEVRVSPTFGCRLTNEKTGSWVGVEAATVTELIESLDDAWEVL